MLAAQALSGPSLCACITSLHIRPTSQVGATVICIRFRYNSRSPADMGSRRSAKESFRVASIDAQSLDPCHIHLQKMAYRVRALVIPSGWCLQNWKAVRKVALWHTGQSPVTFNLRQNTDRLVLEYHANAQFPVMKAAREYREDRQHQQPTTTKTNSDPRKPIHEETDKFDRTASSGSGDHEQRDSGTNASRGRGG